jgi:hypothetical protein
MISNLKVYAPNVRAVVVPFLRAGINVKIHKVYIDSSMGGKLGVVGMSETAYEPDGDKSVTVPVDYIQAFVNCLMEHGEELFLMATETDEIEVFY